MITPEDLRKLKDQLAADEGTRTRPYKDHRGNLTIGIGHNLDAKPLSARAIQTIFEDDVADAMADLDRFLPWWHQLNAPRQRALINMAFQLGIGSVHYHTGLLAFERLLSALRLEDWTGAYRETLDSTYAKQTPERAKRIAEVFRTGEDA